MTPLTAEAATLAHLSREGEATVQAVAEASGRTRSGIAAAMYRLLWDGAIRRKPTPERPPTEPRNGKPPDVWQLTAAGRKLHARHRAAVAEAYELER